MEDLFYNVPTRRRAFRSTAEEYNKILDVVGRYAVHCSGVSFSCKKHGDSSISVSTQASSSLVDRIRHIHGSAVANELIEFTSAEQRLGFQATCWTTNANYHVKKTVLLLFINNRLVESTHIRKSIEQTYTDFLPKGGHPFTYLSVMIDPARIDVNVHPTKREVNMLHEDEIIDCLCRDLKSSLAAVDTSRTFLTQTLLPGSLVPTLTNDTNPRSAPGIAKAKVYENNLVRTDSKLRKITSMLEPANEPSMDSVGAGSTETQGDIIYETTSRQPVTCCLQTIKELRATVRDSMHSNLTEIFASHTFVGLVSSSRRLAAIQSGVKLLLVDYAMVGAEFFYQVGLTDFGNFGTLRFEPPLPLRDLLTLAADSEKEAIASEPSSTVETEFDVSTLVDQVYSKLHDRRDMLLEYFSIEISEMGELHSIPLLLKGYTPSLAKLPRFLLRLGPKVTWTSEKECFDTFLRELAVYYVPEQLPDPRPRHEQEDTGAATVSDIVRQRDDVSQAAHDQIEARRAQLAKSIEHVLFPAFRARLVATKELTNTAVLEVANLKGLYRVFERC